VADLRAFFFAGFLPVDAFFFFPDVFFAERFLAMGALSAG
jgi:hypothetical protein